MTGNNRRVRAEISSPRATRSPSSNHPLEVRIQALNPLQAWEVLESSYHEFELSSWEGSIISHTVIELCIECVESHGLCRKHAVGPHASAQGMGKSLSRSRSASVGATVVNPEGLGSLQENRPSSCGVVEPRKRRAIEGISTN